MNEFVSVCDAAPELSRAWTLRPGDRVYIKYDIHEKDGAWTLIKSGEPPILHEGIYHLAIEDPIHFEEEFRKFSIWLPNIEQLIDMLLGKYGDLAPLLTDFNRFIFRRGGEGRPINMYDFNTLWLLFYMFQVHSKVWDGEQFHKIKTNIWGDVIENT